MIPDTEMVALGFDIGVDNLIVEKLSGLQTPRHTPVVVVQQTAEKGELSFLIQNVDLHEVRKLPSKSMHLLFELANVTLDMSAQQRLHAVVRELCSKFFHRTCGIAKEPS